MRRANS